MSDEFIAVPFVVILGITPTCKILFRLTRMKISLFWRVSKWDMTFLTFRCYLANEA